MYRTSPQPLLLEKIIAVLTYLSAGAIGFIWIILAVFTHNELRPFLRYHVYQSIFLAIIYFLISTFIGLLMSILSFIPIIKNIVGNIGFFLSMPVIGHFSIIGLIILGILLYLTIKAAQGKYSYIPWVSDVINYNVQR